MKPIKICFENADAITAALGAVNGKSSAHTFSTGNEIVILTNQAETAIREVVAVKDAPGARWAITSGGKAPSSYKYERNATRITMERRKSGWFLVDIQPAVVWKEGGGPGRLTLTKEQDAAARAMLATKYSVA